MEPHSAVIRRIRKVKTVSGSIAVQVGNSGKDLKFFTEKFEQEYLEIRTHLLGEHLFKDSPVKYTKITDTSATWRPGDDQRRPAPINGEGIREIGEIGRTTGRWPTVGVKTG